MAGKDYHLILGIGKDAGPEEIKKAYRRLAMRYHPDTSGGDPGAKERFQEINEAYDVLTDRAGRDRTPRDTDSAESGRVPVNRGAPRSARSFGPEPSWVHSRGGGWFHWDFEDLEDLLAGGPFFTRESPRPGAYESNVHEIRLTPAEARDGAERDLRITLPGETLRVTVEIPGGVEEGSMLKVVGPKTGERGIELYLRVRISSGADPWT